MIDHKCHARHRKFDLGEVVFLDHAANRPWVIVTLEEDANGTQTLGLLADWDMWDTSERQVIVGHPAFPEVSTEATFWLRERVVA